MKKYAQGYVYGFVEMMAHKRRQGGKPAAHELSLRLPCSPGSPLHPGAVGLRIVVGRRWLRHKALRRMEVARLLWIGNQP